MLNFRLGLSGTQRTELDRELVEARRSGDLGRVNRVLSILALAEGMAVSEAARMLKVSREAVRGWLKRYVLLGRLGLDYGWPNNLLCMQSKDWAFDFAVFLTTSSENEFIAGEVKKTNKELDDLISDLVCFGLEGTTELVDDNPKKINSYKKWLALLDRKAPFFWAGGPYDYTQLFEVEYNDDHAAKFNEVKLEQLASSNASRFT